MKCSFIENSFTNYEKRSSIATSWSQSYSPKCSSDKKDIINHKKLAENTGCTPILLNLDIIMVFARKKPAGGFKHLSSDIQALEEFSRKPKEDTVKYKFADNYS